MQLRKQATKYLFFKRLYHWLVQTRVAIILWFGLSLITVVIQAIGHDRFNNFIIFRYVFFHTLQQTNLYLEYPQTYADVNLYGPFFSIVIAPFALLPKVFGAIAWVLFNTGILYVAIRKLPIQKAGQNLILVLTSVEMMNASSWVQSNALIAACIVFGFAFIWEGKDKCGVFFILIAFFIKIYGIVGFAFFFFSKNKTQFILWSVIWSVIFFIAPMLIAPPHFIIQSYADWYHGLQEKSAKNIRLDIQNNYQDISAMGILRRLFGITYLKDIWVLAPAALLFLTQYLRFRYFKDIRFGLYLLCSVLLFPVIFSTGSESPTYIIAFPAVCLWYWLQPKTIWTHVLFIFAFMITSFSYSDLLTHWFRENIARPYAIKALPNVIVWCVIVIQIFTKQFLQIPAIQLKQANNFA
ncbi:glycosyltransferase family 87 protein [Hydrotalea sp.]|uniref:glycosyltransferase family 87 protein n=1 Tax=Hydrotalea sp. TaxID=2881279 RepID=UPI002618DB72|nr:glycosyltransferase family 87 protein [Hydrotalea sp.]